MSRDSSSNVNVLSVTVWRTGGVR